MLVGIASSEESFIVSGYWFIIFFEFLLRLLERRHFFCFHFYILIFSNDSFSLVGFSLFISFFFMGSSCMYFISPSSIKSSFSFVYFLLFLCCLCDFFLSLWSSLSFCLLLWFRFLLLLFFFFFERDLALLWPIFFLRCLSRFFFSRAFSTWSSLSLEDSVSSSASLSDWLSTSSVILLWLSFYVSS